MPLSPSFVYIIAHRLRGLLLIWWAVECDGASLSPASLLQTLCSWFATMAQRELTLYQPMTHPCVMVSPQGNRNLYGGFNTRRYTSVHGFCFFYQFLMVGKGLNSTSDAMCCNSIECVLSCSGNILGVRPYEMGTPCSNCPDDRRVCVANLCCE